MYVQKVAQQGGWDKISEICVCMAHLFMAQRKKKGGGTLLYYFEVFPWIFKIWVRFFEEEKKIVFFSLKIDKNSKKIN